MSEERKVTCQVLVECTPEMAFEAVTRASELREWLCDEARTDVRSGGRFDVRWASGYRAEGEFSAVEPPRHAALTWQGKGEPGPTCVDLAIQPVEGGVQVTVVHSGFGPGAEWDKALRESEEGWTGGLENLKSTLETGVDLRLSRRPFLGIMPSVLDAERAAKEGIAVDQGIYVHGSVEGSGAQAAGLTQGDVVVSIGGIPTPGWQQLVDALSARRAGDTVDVELVHGQERRMVQALLGSRPAPEVVTTAGELGDRLAARTQEGDAALKAALEGVTDDEARKAPAEGEWSVVQVLAHLSIVERDQQAFLGVFALDGWLDTGEGNTSVMAGRLDAVIGSEVKLEALLDRFLRDEAESAAFVRRLPDETVSHRARFYRLAQQVLFLPDHAQEHIEQIRKTLAAVRGG